MSFNAHDLKVAFEEGRAFENERILALLKHKIVLNEEDESQQHDYRDHERLLRTGQPGGKLSWKQ